MRVYLCYEHVFGSPRLVKIVSEFESAVLWASRNPEYLFYTEWDVE